MRKHSTNNESQGSVTPPRPHSQGGRLRGEAFQFVDAALTSKVRDDLWEQAQLDGWLRDGSAAYVESLCDWAGAA